MTLTRGKRPRISTEITRDVISVEKYLTGYGFHKHGDVWFVPNFISEPEFRCTVTSHLKRTKSLSCDQSSQKDSLFTNYKEKCHTTTHTSATYIIMHNVMYKRVLVSARVALPGRLIKFRPRRVSSVT